jgi:signal transduction histidine kinase
VASIAAVHGGTAAARPRDGGGLCVTVTIPSARTPVQGGRDGVSRTRSG